MAVVWTNDVKAKLEGIASRLELLTQWDTALADARRRGLTPMGAMRATASYFLGDKWHPKHGHTNKGIPKESPFRTELDKRGLTPHWCTLWESNGRLPEGNFPPVGGKVAYQHSLKTYRNEAESSFGPPAGPLEEIDWVMAYLDEPDPPKSECPGVRAWNLLQYAREDRKGFMKLALADAMQLRLRQAKKETEEGNTNADLLRTIQMVKDRATGTILKAAELDALEGGREFDDGWVSDSFDDRANHNGAGSAIRVDGDTSV